MPSSERRDSCDSVAADLLSYHTAADVDVLHRRPRGLPLGNRTTSDHQAIRRSHATGHRREAQGGAHGHDRPRPPPTRGPSPILRAPAHLPRLRQRQTSAPVRRPSTDRRTSPGASPFTFRRASSKATKAASNSGKHVPRPPGGSASPPPSTTSARPGASAGSRSASSRCAGRGSRASVRRTSPGSTRRATSSRSSRPTRRCTCTRAVRAYPGRRSTWMTTRGRTSCWRWTSPRTCEGVSSGSTRRGAFRKSGCSFRRSPGCARPGLDIHLLRDGRYREAPESGAFSGMAGGGDLPRPHRGSAVTESETGPGAGGAGDGRPRRHPARGRSDHPLESAGGRGSGARRKAAGKHTRRPCSRCSALAVSRSPPPSPKTATCSTRFPATP